MEYKTIRPVALTVVPGTSVTIVIPQINLNNGKHIGLEFCLFEADKTNYNTLIEGIEPVLLQIGINGTSYVVENRKGNILYADKLLIGYCYRLIYGNNGAAATDGTTGLVEHFLCVNSPCCSKSYNPANTTPPTPTTP